MVNIMTLAIKGKCVDAFVDKMSDMISGKGLFAFKPALAMPVWTQIFCAAQGADGQDKVTT